MAAYNAFPTGIGASYDGRPQADMHGMSTREFFLAHILAGMASNPATMLDAKQHVEYACNLADEAWQEVNRRGW